MTGYFKQLMAGSKRKDPIVCHVCRFAMPDDIPVTSCIRCEANLLNPLEESKLKEGMLQYPTNRLGKRHASVILTTKRLLLTKGTAMYNPREPQVLGSSIAAKYGCSFKLADIEMIENEQDDSTDKIMFVSKTKGKVGHLYAPYVRPEWAIAINDAIRALDE